MDERALLSRFLEIQRHRAEIYARLQSGFSEYLESNGELAFKELCNRVTMEFNDCSKQVIAIQAALKEPSCSREDLAALLQSVQAHEKTKLQMTATLQILRRAGHPNERPSAETAHAMRMQCVGCEGEEEDISGLEESQAEAEYLAARREATTCLQETVQSINELMETVRYEIEE